MGLDVAVEEPRAGVVRLEPDRHVVVVILETRADGVPEDGVLVVVLGAVRAADDRERVLEGRRMSL